MDLLHLYRSILDALLQGGYQSIVSAAYKILQLPISLHDAAFNLLAVAPREKMGDPFWDSCLETGSYPRNTIMLFHEQGFMEAASTRKSPYYVDWGDCADLPRIQGVVRVNGIVEGYIALYCPKDIYCDAYEEATTLIVQACAIEMERSRSRNLAEDPLLKVLMNDLIHGRLETQETIDIWNRRLPTTFCGAFQLCAVEFALPNSTAAQKYFLQALPEHCRHIEMIDDGIFYILFYAIAKKDRQLLSAQVQEAMLSLEAHGGMSDMFEGLLQFGVCKQQASSALALGRRLHPEKHLYPYEQYRFDIFTQTILTNPDSFIHIAPGMQALREYDQTYGTEYRSTLECYLSNGCSAKRTVLVLGVHRNTLLYRLQKIEEILAVSLDDPETVLYYSISFGLMRMRERLQSMQDTK